MCSQSKWKMSSSFCTQHNAIYGDHVWCTCVMWKIPNHMPTFHIQICVCVLPSVHDAEVTFFPFPQMQRELPIAIKINPLNLCKIHFSVDILFPNHRMFLCYTSSLILYLVYSFLHHSLVFSASLLSWIKMNLILHFPPNAIPIAFSFSFFILQMRNRIFCALLFFVLMYFLTITMFSVLNYRSLCFR